MKRVVRSTHLLAALVCVLPLTLFAEETRTRIDVQKYTIDASINPRTQSIEATAKIDFTPLENANQATFELNNALTVSKATDDKGATISTLRDPSDFSVRVMFPSGLVKNQPVSISISYDGKLTGNEDSPDLRSYFRGPESGIWLPSLSGPLVPGQRLHHQPFHG